MQSNGKPRLRGSLQAAGEKMHNYSCRGQNFGDTFFEIDFVGSSD